jgi:hypothetical protein
MAVTLETIHREIKHMQNDLYLLKHIMEEEYELSEKTGEKRRKGGQQTQILEL